MEKDLEETLEDLEDDIDESYTLTKNSIIWTEVNQISRSYTKQEKKMKSKFKLDEQVWLNQGRLSLLRARHQIVQQLLEEPQRLLRRAVRCENLYGDLLRRLLLQGLLRLLEPSVVVVARRRDTQLVVGALGRVRGQYRAATGADVQLSLRRGIYLPDDAIGGAVLFASSGLVYTDLTLSSRLANVVNYMLPQIRSELFEAWNLRRHQDTRESTPQIASVMQLLVQNDSSESELDDWR
ncbi:V-type proton ATPase subunit E 1-like [Schistocerca serialis cubense]|uniref:V-type proton ATPase subunit E 1-like n=1 Tax=Schistocerca serialis cubense TaxID=2023355 RepID=UPI00214E63F5|nr:V-type proton ATPase subunit E 1-like [Schistocerca serialis cubense]